MASPGSVVINFITKADQAVRGAADYAKSLGKVDNEAKDLDRTLDTLETELDSIGRASTALAHDMDKAGIGFDGAADDAEHAATRIRKAGDDMGDGIRQGADTIDTETGHIRQNMSEAGSEAGAEFIGNMAEGIGSGTANINDVAQGTLGGLVNMAASIGGPVGVAAGIAAAGIGTLFAKISAEQEKAKEQAQELKDALLEVGDASSAAARKATWQTWLNQLNQTPGLLNQITDAMRGAKIGGDLMQAAITGDPAAQKQVRDRLKEMGTQIADNVRAGKPLTEDQRDYLSNQGKIHEELKRMGIAIDSAGDELSDIEYLTGKNEDASRKWADEQQDVYNKTHNIKKELDAIPNTIPVNVIVTRKDKKGNPSKLGPGQMSTEVGVMAAEAPPTVVNVYTTAPAASLDSPRALVRMLETHQVRMGRRPGAPRAVAW